MQREVAVLTSLPEPASFSLSRDDDRSDFPDECRLLPSKWGELLLTPLLSLLETAPRARSRDPEADDADEGREFVGDFERLGPSQLAGFKCEAADEDDDELVAVGDVSLLPLCWYAAADDGGLDATDFCEPPVASSSSIIGARSGPTLRGSRFSSMIISGLACSLFLSCSLLSYKCTQQKVGCEGGACNTQWENHI